MLTILITFSFGAIVGSFINVVTYRLPLIIQKNWTHHSSNYLKSQGITIIDLGGKDEPERFNLLWPPSHCPHCKHKIKPWENIPLLSYIFLKTKCSNCSRRISYQYPLTELLSGLLTMFLVYNFGLSLLSFAFMLLVWSLLTIAIIDFNHQLIPDEITQPLIWLGLFFNAVGLKTEVSLHQAVLGAILGYLSLWTVNWIFKLIRGKDGLGQGDFKLLAAIGAWLGWQCLTVTIILSSLTGAIVGIYMVTTLGRDKNLSIPFGPYLSAAAFIFIIWGPQINNFYVTNILR